MMIMSGVWFSLEGAHPLVQMASKALPLTHVVEGARSIMIDGATILDVGWNIVYLVIFAIGCVLLGAKLFRWE